MKKIFLYGPPGSGKSTVALALADALGDTQLDLDTLIERQAGLPIPRIMTEQGEPAFREVESQALKACLADGAGVIALGGGALLREENRRLAEFAGTVVCLTAGLETLVARLQADENQRPLLAGGLRGKLAALLGKRSAHYQSFDVRFETEGFDPGQIARQIQLGLGRFHVRQMGQPYDVVVEPGGLDALGACLRERGLGGTLLLVSDANVAALHGERALASLHSTGYEAELVSIPAGEAGKSLETVSSLWQRMLHAGLDRRSTLVALGGGVVTDLAGFAAATFMRGLPWVAVPTSLLGMVDASIGGKTGFDLPEGKNLVGAFHSPRLVLADPQVLSSLPERELRGGLAEAVKSGIVGDPDLFALCADGWEAAMESLAEIVRRSAAVKVTVIEADPYERSVRAALNLGHTVGHAVESVSGFRISHGEAVSIGMVAEARLAEKLGMAPAGLSETIAVVLMGLGLPICIPEDLSREALLRAMRVDKKKAAGVVRFALPVAIGRVEVGLAVDDLNLIFKT